MDVTSLSNSKLEILDSNKVPDTIGCYCEREAFWPNHWGTLNSNRGKGKDIW